MARTGKIIKTNEDVVVISLNANDGCDGCEACSHGTNSNEQKIEAINKLGAEIGDTVEFDITTPTLLSAAFIAYTIPLITMTLSIYLSILLFKYIGVISNAELYASLIGFTTLFLTFVIIRKFDKRMKDSKKFMAIVTRIVIKSNQEVFLNVNR